ncbi:hypothetical protein [Dysgonomonas reticulitermitis]
MKIKLPTKRITKYLRDFSIVVAGIAVTLSLNSWITGLNEKKDTILYLNAIKLELEENFKDIDNDVIPSMEKSTNYARYLLSHDKKSLNQDTIQNYKYVYHNILIHTYKSNAFEMFKTSGNMRFIKDKEVLRSIWEAYSDMEQLKLVLDMYFQQKKEEGFKEYLLEMEGTPVSIPMYNFYMSEFDLEVLRICNNASEKLKAISIKLNKKVF